MAISSGTEFRTARSNATTKPRALASWVMRGKNPQAVVRPLRATAAELYENRAPNVSIVSRRARLRDDLRAMIRRRPSVVRSPPAGPHAQTFMGEHEREHVAAARPADDGHDKTGWLHGIALRGPAVKRAHT